MFCSSTERSGRGFGSLSRFRLRYGYFPQVAGLYPFQSGQDVLCPEPHTRPVVLEKDNDGQSSAREVLLVSQFLVSGNQYFVALH